MALPRCRTIMRIALDCGEMREIRTCALSMRPEAAGAIEWSFEIRCAFWAGVLPIVIYRRFRCLSHSLSFSTATTVKKLTVLLPIMRNPAASCASRSSSTMRGSSIFRHSSRKRKRRSPLPRPRRIPSPPACLRRADERRAPLPCQEGCVHHPRRRAAEGRDDRQQCEESGLRHPLRCQCEARFDPQEGQRSGRYHRHLRPPVCFPAGERGEP